MFLSIKKKKNSGQPKGNADCSVGPSCHHGSECWGNTADLCDSTDTFMWMTPGNNRVGIRPEFVQAREACTMGWECVITKYYLPVYSTGQYQFIRLDKSEYAYFQNGISFYSHGKFHVLVKPTSKCTSRAETAHCAVSKTKLGCRFGTGVDGFYGNVEPTGCTLIGRVSYCVGDI